MSGAEVGVMSVLVGVKVTVGVSVGVGVDVLVIVMVVVNEGPIVAVLDGVKVGLAV